MGLTHVIALPLLAVLCGALAWDILRRARILGESGVSPSFRRQTNLLFVLFLCGAGAVVYLADDARRHVDAADYAAVIGTQLVGGDAFGRSDMLPQETETFRALNDAIFDHHFAEAPDQSIFSAQVLGVFENWITVTLTFSDRDSVYLFIRDRARDTTPWYLPTFAAPDYEIRVIAPPATWVDAARQDGRIARAQGTSSVS